MTFFLQNRSLLQVHNYEILVKIFHVSHNLTWYSAIQLINNKFHVIFLWRLCITFVWPRGSQKLPTTAPPTGRNTIWRYFTLIRLCQALLFIISIGPMVCTNSIYKILRLPVKKKKEMMSYNNIWTWKQMQLYHGKLKLALQFVCR